MSDAAMVTREFPVLPRWDRPVVRCPLCVEGRALLTAAEAEVVIQLAGGRYGGWQAQRCRVRSGWHLVRRVQHCEPVRRSKWVVAAVVAALLVTALALTVL